MQSPGLLTRAAAKELFSDSGFSTVEILVNANDCGVPQNRIRMFAIGSKDADQKQLAVIEAMALANIVKGPDTAKVAAEFGECRRPAVNDVIKPLF